MLLRGLQSSSQISLPMQVSSVATTPSPKGTTGCSLINLQNLDQIFVFLNNKMILFLIVNNAVRLNLILGRY